MKKVIALMMLLFFTMNIMGCSNESVNPTFEQKDKYSILICDFSDSNTGVKLKSEYDEWSKDEYKAIGVDKKITMKILNTEIAAEYENSEVRSYEYFPTHTYIAKNGDKLEITPDGKLSGYLRNTTKSSDSDKALTQDEYIDVAKNFIKAYVNPDEYKITVSPVKYSDFICVTFTKYIGDMRTCDTASVYVYPNGEIYSFYSTLLGRISTADKIEFDLNTVDTQVVDKVKNAYKDISEDYDKINYEIDSRCLTMISDSQYALVYEVTVEFVTNTDGFSEAYSDKIRLIVN